MQTNRAMPPFSVNLLDFYNSTMKTEEGLVVVSGEGYWIGGFLFRSARRVQLDHEDGRGVVVRGSQSWLGVAIGAHVLMSLPMVGPTVQPLQAGMQRQACSVAAMPTPAS